MSVIATFTANPVTSSNLTSGIAIESDERPTTIKRASVLSHILQTLAVSAIAIVIIQANAKLHGFVVVADTMIVPELRCGTCKTD